MKRYFAIAVYIALCALFVVPFALSHSRHSAPFNSYHETIPGPIGVAIGEGLYAIQCTWKFKAYRGGDDGTASVTGHDDFKRNSDSKTITNLTGSASVSLTNSNPVAWVSAFNSTTKNLTATTYTHYWNRGCTVEYGSESHSISGDVGLRVDP
jgi:hypothetical protein